MPALIWAYGFCAFSVGLYIGVLLIDVFDPAGRSIGWLIEWAQR